MRKKRICVMVLTAVLCVLLTGCGGKKPEVTINVKVPIFMTETVEGLEEAADMYTVIAMAAEDFAAQYTEADVTINVSQYEIARRTDEIDDCFDTDMAADVLWGSVDSYIFTGRAVPLDDIISEEIRADIKESVWRNCRVEDRTYIMPFFASQVVLCYNKDLFRQAGLEAYITDEDIIQSWTLEEWEEILETLRANLPATVYPMMMYAADNDGDTHIMVLLRSQGSRFFDERGRFQLNTPEGKAGLSWIREGSEKGYFPANAENMVMLDCYDLFMNEQLAIYCANVALQTLYDEADMEYGLVNFPSADGRGYNTTTTPGFMVMDNGDEGKVQVSKDFVRYIYETDWLDYSTGGIPVSQRVSQKYADQLQNVRKYMDNMDNNVNYRGNNPNWNGVREVFYLHIQDLLFGEKPVEQVAAELDAECNAAIEKGYAESQLHAPLQ